MPGVLAALLCSAVLLWLPGLALTSWLLPRTSRLARVAVAPAVSFGLLFALGSYLDVVGVRVQWQTVALPVVVAAVAALVVRQWRRPWPAVRLTAAHAVLALSVVVAFGLWWYAIRSPETVPTYDDGANAAIFAHRIGLLGTLRPDQIIATDLGDGAGGVAYYPLALHLVASFLVDLTGVDIAAALHVPVAALVAVCLPVGAFALTRRLVRWAPGLRVRPGVAAAAAGVGAAVLPGLPWGQLPWGALALVSGVALMPAVLLPALELPRARAARRRRAGDRGRRAVRGAQLRGGQRRRARGGHGGGCRREQLGAVAGSTGRPRRRRGGGAAAAGPGPGVPRWRARANGRRARPVRLSGPAPRCTTAGSA